MESVKNGFSRWDKGMRIREEGRQAFLSGKPETSCPYKRSFWGFGGAWDQGYYEAKLDAMFAQLMGNPLPPGEELAGLLGG